MKLEHELLVRDRLLAVHAVGRVLRQRLALEDRLRGRRGQPRAARQCGQVSAGDEQARRLADQVVVGRGVQREPAADELRVLVDRVQPAVAELGMLLEGLRRPTSCQAADQLIRRSAASSALDQFGPYAVRAGEEPAVEVLGDRLEVGALAASARRPARA